MKTTEEAKPQGECEYSSYSDSCVSYDNDEEDWAAAKDAVDAAHKLAKTAAAREEALAASGAAASSTEGAGGAHEMARRCAERDAIVIELAKEKVRRADAIELAKEEVRRVAEHAKCVEKECSELRKRVQDVEANMEADR